MALPPEQIISIHALREEGDPGIHNLQKARIVFLSTPSARRATKRPCVRDHLNFISIHALREEGDNNSYGVRPALMISIHALREEGDKALTGAIEILKQFLSTPSARRATGGAGADRQLHDRFLSTPSARRATIALRGRSEPLHISIHALREEGDAKQSVNNSVIGISIHALREEGDLWDRLQQLRITISIHALREEGDLWDRLQQLRITISIHALREEGDPGAICFCPRRDISIHALREEGDSKNRDKISIFKQIIQHSARI